MRLTLCQSTMHLISTASPWLCCTYFAEDEIRGRGNREVGGGWPMETYVVTINTVLTASRSRKIITLKHNPGYCSSYLGSHALDVTQLHFT